MARAALFLVILAGLAPAAAGDPAPSRAPVAPAVPAAARRRVVLADPDPELRHAIEQALAPWRLEVILEGPPPRDAALAQLRADADTARFVVWRDGEQLLVYDRELDATERRSSRSGGLDPVAAAAAALTVKTMMRLPPPPDAPPPPPISESIPASLATGGRELRVQAGVATRFTRSDTLEVSARLGAAAMLRPWSGSGWRFGLAVDGGTATSVARAGFKGSWRDWSALGVTSWTYHRTAWELEPQAGFGVRRSSLTGTEMMAPRSEATTLLGVRVGVAVRRRVQRWVFGAQLAVDASFGTPTYSKAGTPAEIFHVPGTAVELGALIALDL